MNNFHNKSIPLDILKQATDKLNEVTALLKPYLLTLTPDERRYMLKKGDKSSSFVTKAFEFTKINPEFIPAFINAGDFEIDVTDADNLIGIVSLATQLYNGLDDTAMVAGSEAYYASLAYYNNVQLAAGQSVPGAKAVYEELKKKFPGKSRTSETTTTTK
jgi:hypothetical protein